MKTTENNYIENASWISGKYENGEINDLYSYVEVFEPTFFAQGDDADRIINEILHIWNNTNVTQEQAFNRWINNNL